MEVGPRADTAEKTEFRQLTWIRAGTLERQVQSKNYLVIMINHISIPYSQISKLILKIHDEQTSKILCIVKIRITCFSLASGSNVAHIALPGIPGMSSHGGPMYWYES